MRRLYIILLLSFCVLLTGCTVTADRIYIVCKNDNGQLTCYKDNGEFYTLTNEGNLLPTLDPTLRPYPALNFELKDGDYVLNEEIPHLYSGTLTDIECYVNFLLTKGLATSYNVLYTDYQTIELYVYFPDDVYRILYNIYGEIRIYSQNALPILYLNGNKNIEK